MKILGKLTEEQIKLFDDLLICRRACKDIVEETVREYEKSLRDERIIWKLIREKYSKNLDRKDLENLEIDYHTNEIKAYTDQEFMDKKIDKSGKREGFIRTKFEE